MSRFDPFVGIPYADRGRSFAGCDCYGLVWLVMRELCAVDLPAFREDYVTASDGAYLARLIAGEVSAWDAVPLGEERTFDGVLMRSGRLLSHIGIVVEPGKLLHVYEGSDSRIERYTLPPASLRLSGFYRYRGGFT